MLIKFVDKSSLVSVISDRVKVLNEKLKEAREEDDTVIVDTLRGVVEHLKRMKKLAKEDVEIYLDDDDLLDLGY